MALKDVWYGKPGVSREEWHAICDKFQGLCAYCPLPADTMDHIVPTARGGRHTPDNVVPACRSCNSRKGDRGTFPQ